MMRIGTRVLLLSLLGLSAAGCLGSSAGGPAGDETTPGMTGGANAATGGTTASGGADGGGAASGGTAAGATSGTGGTPSGATMTQEEWEAAIAPRPGPHEIWTVDRCEELHEGSTSVRVGQEYSVVPALRQSADYDPVAKPFLDISLEPYCMTSADCTEQPGGVCEGRIAEAYCEYSDSEPREACREDADCTTKANGTCEAPLSLSEYTLCYPTGVCETPSGSCRYSGPCASDADCTEGMAGKCILPVVGTSCSYDSCHQDTDCGLGLRCGCGYCVEADCASDEACGDGHTCEHSIAFCLGRGGFHCSTTRDTCVAGEPGCVFQPESTGGRWARGRCTI